MFAGRGFTAHEHLEDFKLINMNGRLYDPVVGRFLSPDPYVQMPDFSQNFNRYSYCLNNPLKYNDPNGEFFLELLAVIVGNYIIGWLDNVINKGMSPKEAFRNTNFIIGVNFSPSDMSTQNNYGLSDPQVDAHKAAKHEEKVSRDLDKFIASQSGRGQFAEYYTAQQDATFLNVPLYGGVALGQNQVFNAGDALTVYNAIVPEGKKIPYLGHLMTGIDVYRNIQSRNYAEATWDIIGAAGNLYTVGFKSLAYVYQSDYAQTKIGQGFYQDYNYNLSMYRITGNERYLDNAIYYERLMRKVYNNIQRK